MSDFKNITINDDNTFTIELGSATFRLEADAAQTIAAYITKNQVPEGVDIEELLKEGRELPNPLNLNAAELDVLKAMEPSSEGNGHDFGFTDEVNFEALGLTKNQYAGYVSSLKAKGVFSCFADLSKDPGIQCNSVQFQFSDEAFATLGLDDQMGLR